MFNRSHLINNRLPLIRGTERLREYVRANPKTEWCRGSILLEALVGVLLYATAFVTVLALVATSFSTLASARRAFLATRAAREGMEIALSKHQNHLVCRAAPDCPITDWQDNLTSSAPFEVDSLEADRLNPDQQFRAYSDTPLCTVDAPAEHRGQFIQCAGTGVGQSPLPGEVKRRVDIQQIDEEKARIRVEVTWNRRAGDRASLVLEEIVFGPAE